MNFIKKIKIGFALKKNKILQLFLCTLGALGVFIALLYLEKNIMAPNGLREVIVAKIDIPESQLITDSNYNDFFEVVERDLTTISENAITSSDLIVNKILKNGALKGNYVSEDELLNKDSLLTKIENPVEFSIMATDIGQVVGGTIREGDIISIGVIDGTSKDYVEAKEIAYVRKALKSDGTEIDRFEEGTAVVINVITSKEDRANIEGKIAKGKVSISKIKDLDSIK